MDQFLNVFKVCFIILIIPAPLNLNAQSKVYIIPHFWGAALSCLGVTVLQVLKIKQ